MYMCVCVCVCVFVSSGSHETKSYVLKCVLKQMVINFTLTLTFDQKGLKNQYSIYCLHFEF